MDLEKLKKEADVQKSQITEEERLREEIFTELKELYKMMEYFDKALSNKTEVHIEEFFKEAESYFRQNGFTTERRNPTKEVQAGTEFIANYNGLDISFTDINYHSDKIMIHIGEEVRQFQFGIPNERPNYYGWITNVDICGKKLYPLGNDPEVVYQYFVKEDTCLDELYVISKEITEDQSHFRRGIYELEQIKLGIFNHDKSQSYSDFKEFWKAL